MPRPPLRGLALHTRRCAALAWHHGLDRFHAARREAQRDVPRRLRVLDWRARRSLLRMTAAALALVDANWQAAQAYARPHLAAAHVALRRTLAPVVATLDARVRQPALWPFRPAQREMLARSLAALSMAFVALAWIAAYSTLTPTDAARPPAPSAAPPKEFTGRVVSPALLPAAAPAPDFAF